MTPRPLFHFVTGRLAEPALRDLLETLSRKADFDYDVDVLKITVAALMTTQWIAPRLNVAADAARIILPGYCGGDLQLVEDATGIPVERGPKDLRELPAHFGQQVERPDDYGGHDVEILAEINHASRLSLKELLAQAHALRRDGADLIDVGCDPGSAWSGVGDAVRALREAGHRVSIDSYHPREIQAAAAAGAELVLSVNSTNREHASEWGIEVVAVPDDPHSLAGLQETLDVLDS
ncbi:MAG: DUF6513 domain-containing protein, partial [Planctomycetales bacterium]